MKKFYLAFLLIFAGLFFWFHTDKQATPKKQAPSPAPQIAPPNSSKNSPQAPQGKNEKTAEKTLGHSAQSGSKAYLSLALTRLYSESIEDLNLARRVSLIPHTNSPTGIRMNVSVDGIPVFNEIVEFREENNGVYSIASQNTLAEMTPEPEDFPTYSGSEIVKVIEDYFNSKADCQLRKVENESQEYWLKTQSELRPSVRYKVRYKCRRSKYFKSEYWFYSPIDKRRIKVAPLLH